VGNGNTPVEAGDVIGVNEGMPGLFGILTEIVGEVEARKRVALSGEGEKLEKVSQFACSQINLRGRNRMGNLSR
jgi:hypothetical protein